MLNRMICVRGRWLAEVPEARSCVMSELPADVATGLLPGRDRGFGAPEEGTVLMGEVRRAGWKGGPGTRAGGCAEPGDRAEWSNGVIRAVSSSFALARSIGQAGQPGHFGREVPVHLPGNRG